MTNNLSDTFGDPDFNDEPTDEDDIDALAKHLQHLHARVDRLLREYHGQHDQKKHGRRGVGTGRRKGGFLSRVRREGKRNIGAAIGVGLGTPFGPLGIAAGGLAGAGIDALRARRKASRLRTRSRKK